MGRTGYEDENDRACEVHEHLDKNESEEEVKGVERVVAGAGKRGSSNPRNSRRRRNGKSTAVNDQDLTLQQMTPVAALPEDIPR